MLVHPIEFEDAWITVINYGRILAAPTPTRRWEAEAQVGIHHSGVQKHQEFNAAILHRWYDWPWDGLLRTSLAAGTGLSWATEVPFLEGEARPGRNASQLLLYMALELEVTPHWARSWSLFARIHHRSGVFGTFNGVHGGSDPIGIGLRWYLP
jgi:hypothetical protein